MTFVCSLASGSSGNCLLVSDGRTNILVDAGISLRRAEKCLAQLGITGRDIAAVLITHEHSDHISGLASITGKFGMPVYAARETARYIRFFMPETEGLVREFCAGESFELGGTGVLSFLTPHDTPESVGYKLCTAEGKIGIVTDLGHVPRRVFSAVCDSDMLILEANHDIDTLKRGRYPYFLKRRILGMYGHLSNDDCAQTACEAAESGARHIVLAHLSIENNTPEMAYGAVCSRLTAIGANVGTDLELDVAPRSAMSKMYVLNKDRGSRCLKSE